jgi:endonuclease/exonuclease/phosphatase family metal-dependent hydrolase
VISELGRTLNMNWAYGNEFVEVDPINLGTEDFEGLEDAAEREKLVAEIRVDKAKLRGLHGTAILSRYPIREVQLVPFETTAYDWFGGEKGRVAPLEKGKRAVTSTVFMERVSREVRRGGRTMLIATIDVPYLPEKTVTVAAPHLENRTKPENRRKQMAELLGLIGDKRNPVIIAGDLNTTLGDTQPTSIKREVYRRVGSSEFWVNTGIKYATGVGLLYDVVKGSVNFIKNQQDPTAKNIPIVGPNPEAQLFDDLENFRFQDGTVFDFRGDKAHTINGTEGTLANSNQRDDKGFKVTYEVERTIGPAGKLKLDWIFVKSYLESPRNSKGPYRFAPHFARTLEELNYAGERRLSDHNPIVVDLPFSEPPDLVAQPEKVLETIEVSEAKAKEKNGFRLWPFGK